MGWVEYAVCDMTNAAYGVFFYPTFLLFRNFVLRSEQASLAAPPQVDLVEDAQMQLGRDPAEKSHHNTSGDFICGLAVTDQTQKVSSKSPESADRGYNNNCESK